MNELALFAGAGGGILGGILSGFTTVCAVEKEPYCREVLLRRQRDGVLPLFPVWDDIRTFDGRPWSGAVDIVTAGFPCQPFSVAGKRLGADDERNLWPDTIRVIREVGPEFAFLENSPNLLADDYFGEILGSLAEAGLDAEWGVVSAGEVGAWHLRERLWILAYDREYAHGHGRRGAGADVEASSDVDGERGSEGRTQPQVRERLAHTDGRIESSPNPQSDELRDEPGRRNGADGAGEAEHREPSWWAVEPGMGRVVHGLPRRVDRIRALGNGQVPRVAQEAWERLK